MAVFQHYRLQSTNIIACLSTEKVFGCHFAGNLPNLFSVCENYTINEAIIELIHFSEILMKV
jgi:hypothetical protein